MTRSEMFNIIQKYNPAGDAYHTHIRSAEECKTWAEVMQQSDADENYEIYPHPETFTEEDAIEALQSGKIKIYHGNEANEIGCFVSTDKGMAYEYAGGSGQSVEIYAAEVSTDSIAWINTGEGIAIEPIEWKKISFKMI